MAKSRVSDMRSVCTKAELALLMASRPNAIDVLSVGNLRRNAASARRLRDKWRELSTRQLRETQRRQQSRVTDDNARSEEKAELFAQALTRFEARLTKLGASAGGARIGRQAADTSSRAPDHARSDYEKRSVSRGQLSQMRGDFNAARGAAESPPRKKAAGKQARASSPKAAPAAKKVGKPPRKTEPLPADREQQREARGAATRSRGRGTGLLTRSRGHILARGGRAQKKRDSR
jgi:hypothetical protein